MKTLTNKLAALSTLSLVSLNAVAATAVCACGRVGDTIACVCVIF
ncbi:hypothetical protein [Psychrosphaera ytuae]|nr:hypothetical protein [Psychrosphaera ytuae]